MDRIAASTCARENFFRAMTRFCHGKPVWGEKSHGISSQTSPRRAFGMFGLSFVVGLEGFVGGSNQIRFRLDAASVVVNNSAAALAELVVNGPFDPDPKSVG